jgi:hypothetical protein
MIRLAAFLATGMMTLSAATPLVRHTFENDDEGWTSLGQNGELRVTREPADVKTGKGALAFDYDVSHGPAFVAWPVAESLTGMQSLRFWLKTDSPAPVAVLLNEQAPGGHYIRILWSPANTWQHIELQPSDFALNEGPNDPKDPDNRLDVGELQSVGLFDLSQIYSAAAKTSTLPIVMDEKTGKHTMFIDDFEISSEALPSPKASGEGVVIDDFARPVLQWITLGGIDLSTENHGMRARYRQEEDKYPILLKLLSRIDLRGWNRLAFDIASDKPAQLVISIEEHNPGKPQGPRYSTTVDVLGGGKAEHRAVTFSAFALDPNGPTDPDGQLDLDQVKTISILDITAASTHESAANSLWIGNVRTAEPDRLPLKPR